MATSVCYLSMSYSTRFPLLDTAEAAALADGDDTGAARNVGDGAAVAVLLGMDGDVSLSRSGGFSWDHYRPAVDARALPLAVSIRGSAPWDFTALLTVVLQIGGASETDEGRTDARQSRLAWGSRQRHRSTTC